MNLNAIGLNNGLGEAASLRSFEHLKVLIKFGLDPKACKQLYGQQAGASLLHLPRVGTEIDELVALGLDVNGASRTGHTALHMHARLSDLSAVESLLLHGADPNGASNEGVTPLMESTCHQMAKPGSKPREVMRALVQAGADLEAKDAQGRTALHHASMFGSTPALLELLQLGADMEAEDHQGLRPLHWAVRREAITMVSLVALGASPKSVWSPKDKLHNHVHGSRLMCALLSQSVDVLQEHLARYPRPDEDELKAAMKYLKKEGRAEETAQLQAHMAMRQIKDTRSVAAAVPRLR